MSRSRQERITELSKRFGKLMAEVRDEIDGTDPRSYDFCIARMEEALMWANKAILSQGEGSSHDN